MNRPIRTIPRLGPIAAALIGTLLVACAAGEESRHLADGLYAKMETTQGEILLRLEYEKAPMTVMNFVGLAEGTIPSSRGEGVRYYDGLTFHRVIDDFMIQGGDPEGTGRGGPGYRFPNEIHPDLRHDGPGVLSMANAGPDTNGSQFFITHKATPWLDGDYSIFGRVEEGQDVVDAIRIGDTIERVEILRVGSDAEAFVATQETFDEARASAEAAKSAAANREMAATMETIAEKWPAAQRDDNGIFFIIEEAGSGSPPRRGQTVSVHYTGTFLDGRVFDSSRQRGQPIEIPAGAGRVIPGWDLTLVQMQVGEKRTIIVPPELAYGSRGAGNGLIPPDTFLVFEMELLEIR